MNDYIAGLVGGLAGLVVGHPLDTVKALMQTKNAGKNSVLSVIRQTPISGYFRGLTIPFITYGPLNSALFGLYGQAIASLHNNKSNDAEGARSNSESNESSSKIPTLTEVWIAGTAAGIVVCLPTNPVELIKTQLQTHGRGKLKGIGECAQEIIKKDGYRGFTKGLQALTMRDSLSYGLYFVMFEAMRRQLRERNVFANDMMTDFIAGGVAGSVGWALILPLDIVKTRQQSDRVNKRGMLETMRALTREQGLKAHFTLGLAPLLFRGFLVNATTFAVYIQTLKFLNDNFEEQESTGDPLEN